MTDWLGGFCFGYAACLFVECAFWWRGERRKRRPSIYEESHK